MIGSRVVPPLPKLSSSISVKSTSSGLNSFRTDDSRAHYCSAATLFRGDWQLHQEDDLVTPCQGRKKMTPADFNIPPPSENTSTTGNNDGRMLSDFGNWTAAESSHSPASSLDGSIVPAPTTAPAPTGGNKKTQYHKTKLCPWHREGKCFMGAACNYAHSREELRPKPDLSKTKLCPEVLKGRPCTKASCRFAHDFVELRATAAFFKTRLCKYWQKGHCPAGDDCRHAHGREEVRAPAVPPTDSVSPIPEAIEPMSARGGFNSFTSRYAIDPPPPNTCRGRLTWDHTGGGGNMLPPAANQLPSPSFLSNSTTPSPTGGGRQHHQPPGLPPLQHCATFLNGTYRAGDEGALNLLKSWISQEVERQVQIRQHAAETTEPDEACFLPADVLLGLNTTTPANAGRGGRWLSSHSPDATTTSGASPATFAAAVKSMVSGTTPCDDRSPTHLLLKTLGDLSACFPPMPSY